ncbi:restriction endonuclease subunit S [Sinorhizobium garamanticum]|uniref:Restriction endonuclease subunit S n=1 Tax=Sinorhizobium garamanticum TaxID=680247 RepID=A0ABY8DHU2_9HYPH|nr:restriction endonuclease subunit S [Sinorhizobium garamanticum]WEX88498.1 restriction endonuclease subunit S [Sinorhizobium garamanticum]
MTGNNSSWLGALPSSWMQTKLKRVVNNARPITYGIVQAGPMVEGGIPYIRPADMTDEAGVTDFDAMLRTSDEIAASYKRSSLLGGDLVCSIGPSFGKVMVVPKELEGANLTQGTARVAIAPECCNRYYFWVLRSRISFAQWESIVGGATFRALNLEPLAETEVPQPPLPEQTAIATFLDRETAKIDALVEDQKRLIKLLTEKRQAVISHAVTKGLNPDAPMKDTGIEWLGEVPERWRICRLKHIAARDGIQMGPFGGMLKDLETEPTGYRLYGQENTITGNFALGSRWLDHPRFCELNRYKLEPGDLVMTRKGSIGNCRLFPDNADPGVADSDTIRLRLDPAEIKAEYALRLLHDAMYVQTQLSLVKRGAILAGLNTEVVANLVLVLPPADEQQEILSRLQYVSDVFQRSLDDVAASIALLQERRAALISAAVTGKIDVRGQSTSTVVTPDFRQSRKLVAAKIVEDLSGQKTFGRVKLQKLLYLAEAHASIHELSGHYVREAAGPLDRDMVREVETALQVSGHVVIEQPEGRGTAVNYQLRGTKGAFETELQTLLGDRISALSELIETVGALDTRGAEAVATLYAVWNDALASGTVTSDDEIIREVLNEWHPKKAETFTVADLKHWLAWMRRNGLKPKGNAPVTSTGRLFV